MAKWISRIPEVTAGLTLKADVAPKAAADRVVQGAKRRSRVDTGRMRDGWDKEETGRGEYTVFNDVDYTIYNELGTMHMSAQPMLSPALEEEYQRDLMAKDIDEVLGGMGLL
jgi:HK97 gp10 family phage protein